MQQGTQLKTGRHGMHIGTHCASEEGLNGEVPDAIREVAVPETPHALLIVDAQEGAHHATAVREDRDRHSY